MNRELADKRALVTGGGSGIGAATCRALAAAGAYVAMLDRDVLVNCAGTITRHTIAHLPAKAWERVIVVNLRGPFNGIQAVLPHMRARGGGAVVNIASVAGRRISFGGRAH